MKRPFVYFTISLILGITFAYYIDIKTLWLLGLLIGLILLQIIRINKSKGPMLFLALFLLGAILNNLKLNASHLLEYKDQPLTLRGQVVDILNTSQEEARYILLVDGLQVDGRPISISEKTVLKIIGKEKLDLGDRIKARGVLREPLANTNPRLYNYKENLLTKGIYTQITLRDYGLEGVEKSRLGLGLALRSKFTQRVGQVLDHNLGEKGASIMKSIILGQSSQLDEGDGDLFRDLGLSHMLAVSGLHIGIIAGLLGLIFSSLAINKKINIFLTLTLLWIYAYAIGNPNSVLRANLMFSFLLLSSLLHEAYDSINILALSCFILLVFNPLLVFSLGFQLSYLASFFILYLGPRLANYLPKSIAGIMAIQIGLLPIQAYYFNRIPLLSLVANLLLVPTFSLALVLSLLLVSFLFPYGYLGWSAGRVIDFLLAIQLKIMEALNYFPILNLRMASFSLLEILAYYLILSLLFRIIRVRRLNKYLVKSISLYLLVLIVFNLFVISLDESIGLDFIDVGQGDSILIRTQGGAYLLDTGGNIFGDYDIGENIVLPYLSKEGIFKLKGVFISHFDGDHCKSLPYLIDNIRIENIYLGYTRPGNVYYEEIISKAREKNIPVKVLDLGDSLALDKNTKVTVLGPDKAILSNPSNSDNDMSLVLTLAYYGRKVLFTGDIEKIGEGHLENHVSQADFIKVPHHGSKTSSSPSLLDRVRPRTAFISLGRNNSFGHPHEEVLEEYENRGVDIYRTDEGGLIKLVLNREAYEIIPYLKEKPGIGDLLKEAKLCIIVYMAYMICFAYMTKYFISEDGEMKRIELQGIY